MTIYGRLARIPPRLVAARERLEFPDGDFIDVDRFPGPSPAAPVVVVCHGLESSSRAPYVRGFARIALAAHYSARSRHPSCPALGADVVRHVPDPLLRYSLGSALRAPVSGFGRGGELASSAHARRAEGRRPRLPPWYAAPGFTQRGDRRTRGALPFVINGGHAGIRGRHAARPPTPRRSRRTARSRGSVAWGCRPVGGAVEPRSHRGPRGVRDSW